MIRRVLLVLVPVVFVSTLSYADETGFAFEEGQKVGMEFVGPNDEAPVKEVDGWPTTDDIAKLQEGAYSALRAFIESWHDASWQVTVAAIGQIGTCEADPCSNLDAACEVIYQRNGGYGPVVVSPEP